MSSNQSQLFAKDLAHPQPFFKNRLRVRIGKKLIARKLWLVVLMLLCASATGVRAAVPLSDTLSPTATAPVNWLGTATGPANTSPVTTCREGLDCDTFILTFGGTTDDWAGLSARIQISWELPATDYDLYVLRETPGGLSVIAQSVNRPTTSHDTHEVIDFYPGFYGTGRYLVRVMYTAATFRDQYNGSAAVVSPISTCRLPGVPVLNDHPGDASDAQSNHDIKSVSIAEPYLVGTSKLVFTMKVSGLDSLSTQTSWRVYFRAPSGASTRYFVEMKTDLASTSGGSIVNVVSYRYGTADGTIGGDADEGHYNPQTGTITITVANNKVGNPRPNQSPVHRLFQIYAQVLVGSVAVDSAPNTNPDLSTASYMLVGNSMCNPGKLAFTSDNDGNNEVYVMDFGVGGAPINLTHHSATEYSPSWSPDGRKITFASSRAGSHDIFMMDSDGSNLTNLTNIFGSDLEPAWSPDGKLIAFDGWRSGSAQIYVMNASGTNQVRLTNDTNFYRTPTWSPDGKRLAFVGGPGLGQIYLMDADGTDMQQLTNDEFENMHSAWSPDGTRIAFSSMRDDTDNAHDIYVMDADGSNLKRLTAAPGEDYFPAWSPDGLCIVFTSTRDGNQELYAMNADGSNQTRLTNSPASEASPAWQPNSPPMLQPTSMIVLTKSSKFDADNKADLAFWRASNATWNIIKSSDSSTKVQTWGESADVPVPGDYNGDGITDVGVFKPTSGIWLISLSGGGISTMIMPAGQRGDLPAPGDYDGDGKTDVAYFRQSEARWYIHQSSDGSIRLQFWGTIYDRLMPGDYDGDGKTDIAFYRPSTGYWNILKSSGGTLIQQWGGLDDVPVPADYDGDGRIDLAVMRQSEDKWYIKRSSDGLTTAPNWGTNGDLLVPADYDGDGKADLAVWRPGDGRWYVLRSSDGTYTNTLWGQSTDMPLLYFGVN